MYYVIYVFLNHAHAWCLEIVFALTSVCVLSINIILYQHFTASPILHYIVVYNLYLALYMYVFINLRESSEYSISCCRLLIYWHKATGH